MSKITVVRGDTKLIQITALQNGVAVDLAGCDLWFTVKDSKQRSDSDAVIQKTIGDGISVGSPTTNGQFTVTIDPEDTEDLPFGEKDILSYYWDCQLKNGSDQIFTFASGTLEVTPDVTRSTT
jgi:hypothetical protein